MRITPDPPIVDSQHIISTLSNLVNSVNIETTSAVSIQLYEGHPQQFIAAFLVLSSENHDSQDFQLFSVLMKGLLNADLRIGTRVLLDLVGLEVGFISVYK